MPDPRDNPEEQKIDITDEMVKDFIRDVLKLEQESLYVKKHGLKDNIISEVKKRIK